MCELIGVYHANGDLWGELSYWVGARLGRTHCSLCDITHGMFRRKALWDRCADALPVPFTTFHLNDQPCDVAGVTGGRTPCVVGRTTGGELVMLVDADGLAACGGQPEALVDAIAGAVEAQGMFFGGPPQGSAA